jgi:hypothetical protein
LAGSVAKGQRIEQARSATDQKGWREMSDARDDLEGRECDKCERTFPGPDYNGEPGFCVAPWADDRSCERLYVAKLELQAGAATKRIAELEGELRALDLLCGYASESENHVVFSVRDDGRRRVDVGTNVWATGDTAGRAALRLAAGHGLLPEPKEEGKPA